MQIWVSTWTLYKTTTRSRHRLALCGGSTFKRRHMPRPSSCDVAVDIRKGSPTYGRWAGYTLSAKNGAQLFVPIGFAHGFATLEPESEIVYKCSDYYAPESEGALRWDDPAIGIDWPLSGKAILSGKDTDAPLLADLESPFTWEGAA